MGILSSRYFRPESRWWTLSSREQQVAQFITDGRSNKYTAYELGISRRTVESHRSNIYRKYNVRSAQQLFVTLLGELA